jgi:hypothetical protein
LLLGKKSKFVDLSITADNQILELFFDGKQVTVPAGEWPVVRTIPMPVRTRTIAVKSRDTGVCLFVSVSWFCCVTRSEIEDEAIRSLDRFALSQRWVSREVTEKANW